MPNATKAAPPCASDAVSAHRAATRRVIASNAARSARASSRRKPAPSGAQHELATNGAQHELAPSGAQHELAPSGAQHELAPSGAQHELATSGGPRAVAPHHARVMGHREPLLVVKCDRAPSPHRAACEMARGARWVHGMVSARAPRVHARLAIGAVAHPRAVLRQRASLPAAAATMLHSIIVVAYPDLHAPVRVRVHRGW